MTTDSRMASLARSCPTLRVAPGVEPWDAPKFDLWAAGPAPSSGGRHAARFVLAVWNDTASWMTGRFSVTEAIQIWDESHHKAFHPRVAHPWLP